MFNWFEQPDYPACILENDQANPECVFVSRGNFGRTVGADQLVFLSIKDFLKDMSIIMCHINVIFFTFLSS